MIIKLANLEDLEVANLIKLHFEEMHLLTPKEFAFVLDLESLKNPDIKFYGAWIEGKLAGVGALKIHSEGFGEIKSMRTHPDFLRKGVGKAILEKLIERASSEKLHKVFLETGVGTGFEAANDFYIANGFKECGAFANYLPSEYNKFYELKI